MDIKRKVIVGLKKQDLISRPRQLFTQEQKHEIIQDYFSSGSTKQEIWEKYMGHNCEHGHLLRWMRQLGYPTTIPQGNYIFERKSDSMTQKKKTEQGVRDDFETRQLKKRIEELENQLKDAEMKAIAFSMMIDIAEEELNIPIRKKLNTKPSKK